jgi:NADH dehydrogenase
VADPATICLLGGAGFVGSRLAARLINRGYAVVIPTRAPASRRHLLVLPTVRVIEADVNDPDALSAALRGCHAAVNLVGILNEKGRDGTGFRQAHTLFAERLVSACERRGVARLVHISALRADAASGPSYYLRTKGEAERAITSAASLGWTVLRPSVIFGPGDSFTNRFAGLLRRMPWIFPLAMPDSRFAPVHVDDVVEAIARCLDDPATAHKTYELCGPEALTLREIVRRIASVLGLKRRVLGLPRPVSRLQAQIMEFVPGKPFSTDNFLSLTVDSVCTQDGMAALGIEPRSFDAQLPAALGVGLTRSRLDTLRRAAGRSGS